MRPVILFPLFLLGCGPSNRASAIEKKLLGLERENTELMAENRALQSEHEALKKLIIQLDERVRVLEGR